MCIYYLRRLCNFEFEGFSFFYNPDLKTFDVKGLRKRSVGDQFRTIVLLDLSLTLHSSLFYLKEMQKTIRTIVIVK